MNRNCAWVGTLAVSILTSVACGAPDSEPERISAAVIVPNEVVSDRFELQWELDGEDLLLAIDTDLPDEGELSVSVQRSYYQVGDDNAYSRNYLSVFEPVSRWREPRRIPLDSEAWRADLAAFQNEMAEFAAAVRSREAGVPVEDTVAFEVASIDDDVTIRAVLTLNQDDPRFGGVNNPSLTGDATSRLGNGVVVEAEANFEFPLE